MKEGYVNASVLKIIFTGAGGVGKTHAICLLRGVDPPDPNYRQSTNCINKAVPLRVDASNDEKWEEIDKNMRLNIIADGIIRAVEEKKKEQELVLTSSQMPQPKQKQQQPEVDPKQKAQLQPEVDPKLLLEMQLKQQLPQSMVLSEPLETELDLIKRIHEAIMSGEFSGEVLGIKWVYVVDTGGQPPFHELLSAFIKGTSVCAFVFKLSESLEDHPPVEYWREGMEVGKSFKHPLSNRQILEQNIQTIQALPSLSSDEPSKSPLLFAIGTHRDEQGKCTNETLEDKEKILHEIMKQSGCNFQYNPHGTERVVFDVNAKNPGPEDIAVASTLRKVIANKMPEPKKIPLRYYGLELELEHLATTKGVISMEECCAIGDRLNFDEDGLKAALRFLHKLNVLLYYPEVNGEVEKLIFCDPLILIKIVTKVVAHVHLIKHWSEVATKEWKNSCERGFITIEQLNTEEFRSCFRSDIFTPKILFKLFEHLLIVARVNEKDQQFFMPCLLDDLETTEINRPISYCSPLTFEFRKEGKSVYAPSGLFSALVAFLLSLPKQDCFWTIKEGDKVYRNIIVFHSRNPPADITLINLHTSFEVFTECQTNYLHEYLPEIRRIVSKGLEEAKKVRNFEHVEYNEAFTCKCSEAQNKLHLAEITTCNTGEMRWSCPYRPVEGGPLDTTEQVWYGVKPASKP